MDLRHFFSIILNLSTLVFVVASMLLMGLSLTIARIVEITSTTGILPRYSS
jgi:hypothetical protein